MQNCCVCFWFDALSKDVVFPLNCWWSWYWTMSKWTHSFDFQFVGDFDSDFFIGLWHLWMSFGWFFYEECLSPWAHTSPGDLKRFVHCLPQHVIWKWNCWFCQGTDFMFLKLPWELNGLSVPLTVSFFFCFKVLWWISSLLRWDWISCGCLNIIKKLLKTIRFDCCFVNPRWPGKCFYWQYFAETLRKVELNTGLEVLTSPFGFGVLSNNNRCWSNLLDFQQFDPLESCEVLCFVQLEASQCAKWFFLWPPYVTEDEIILIHATDDYLTKCLDATFLLTIKWIKMNSDNQSTVNVSAEDPPRTPETAIKDLIQHKLCWCWNKANQSSFWRTNINTNSSGFPFHLLRGKKAFVWCFDGMCLMRFYPTEMEQLKCFPECFELKSKRVLHQILSFRTTTWFCFCAGVHYKVLQQNEISLVLTNSRRLNDRHSSFLFLCCFETENQQNVEFVHWTLNLLENLRTKVVRFCIQLTCEQCQNFNFEHKSWMPPRPKAKWMFAWKVSSPHLEVECFTLIELYTLCRN